MAIEMSDKDKIEAMVVDLAMSLMDLPDDQVEVELDSYNLPPDWREDVLTTLKEVKEAEAKADDPSSLNNGVEDFSADAETDAQNKANEDDTPVTVTEEDSDADGDTDKTTIEKDEPEDDSFTFGTGVDKDGNKHEGVFTWPEDSNKDKDNSNESEDKPHDSKVTSDVRMKNIDNSTNSIARTLANYRW